MIFNEKTFKNQSKKITFKLNIYLKFQLFHNLNTIII
jgi:hypothetical protein